MVLIGLSSKRLANKDPLKLKISFVLPYASVSGGVRVVGIYANALAERGHEVSVVSQPDIKPPLLKRLTFKKEKRAIGPLPPAPFFRPLGKRHKVIKAHRPIVAEDVPDGDVVIATWWETAEWVSKFPSSKGKKAYFIQGYETWSGVPVERLAATYDLGLHNIAVSKVLADTIRNNHGISTVHVVPNGIDTSHFASAIRGKNEPLRLGFIYSPLPQKNMALMLDIVERTKLALPDVQFLAFGAAEPSARLKSLGVKYLKSPAQRDIPKLYAACDAWVVTSTEEGFGLPVLESMACGTPVLSTATGIAEEIITGGETGWVLPASLDHFFSKISALQSMPSDEWMKMSKHSRATAELWGWEACIDKFEYELLQLSKCSAASGLDAR